MCVASSATDDGDLRGYGILLDPEEMMELNSVATIQAAIAAHGGSVG